MGDVVLSERFNVVMQDRAVGQCSESDSSKQPIIGAITSNMSSASSSIRSESQNGNTVSPTSGFRQKDALSENEQRGSVQQPFRQTHSHPQEVVRIDSSLFQNCPQRSFRHVPWVIRQRCVTIRAGIEPDFMATGGLPVELESAYFQFPCNIAVSETCQPSHSPCDHDCVVSTLTSSRQTWNAVSLATRFD